MGFTEKMKSELSFSCDNPVEKVLVVKSRVQGRRLLQGLAREGTALLNVSVETPLTLAKNICAEGSNKKLLDPLVASNAIYELLCNQKEGFYAREVCKTKKVAELLYQTFVELEEVEKEIKLSGSQKQEDTEKIRRAYKEFKEENNYMDQADLFVEAKKLARDTTQWKNTQFYTLKELHYSFIERELIDALSEMHGCKELSADLNEESEIIASKCRFVKCRGVETEIRFVFRDILEKEYPIEDTAVVYFNQSYAEYLYSIAPRWEIPLTLAGGISMQNSQIFSLLKEILAFKAEHYPVKRLYTWLTTTLCGPSHPIKLANTLAKKDSVRGMQMYQLTENDRAEKDEETFEGWKEFLNLLLELGNEKEDIVTQKEKLVLFLGKYLPFYRKKEITAAYSVVLSTLDTVALVIKEGESLLENLVSTLETKRYQPLVMQESSLLCMPLEQALLSGKKYLYLIGMSQYALDTVDIESPILLDKEREQYEGLDTAKTKTSKLHRSFECMVYTHGGELIFSYPNFDSESMLEVLPSSYYLQFYNWYNEANKDVEIEEVTYIPEKLLTISDYILNKKSFKNEDENKVENKVENEENNKDEVSSNYQDKIKKIIFSASSLENAYKCPYMFYLQKVCGLQQKQLNVPAKDMWLESTIMGTVAHAILEEYYKGVIENQKEEIETIMAKVIQDLELKFPCYNELENKAKEQEIKLLKDMVQCTLESTAKEEALGNQIIATEEKFGTEQPLELQFGDHKIAIRGSIDRIDKLADGTYQIVDYKTSVIR